MEQDRTGGFLPPEPAGPEPELGDGETREQSPAGPPQPPTGGPQAPAGGQPPTYGWHQGQQYAPPPPGYGWQQPPPAAPGWQQPPPWGYPPAAREPDNGPAIAGFVLSLVGGGLLLFSAGLSTIVSLGCSIAGIVYSRKGKNKVDSGETSKSRGLAQAGYIIGIVSTVLAVLATIFWVLILILALTDDEFQNDLDREFDDSDSISASLRAVSVAVRVGTYLLS